MSLLHVWSMTNSDTVHYTYYYTNTQLEVNFGKHEDMVVTGDFHATYKIYLQK